MRLNGSWFLDFFLSGNVDQYEDHITYASVPLVIVCLKVPLSVMTSPSMVSCCIILHFEYHYIDFNQKKTQILFNFLHYDFQTWEFPQAGRCGPPQVLPWKCNFKVKWLGSTQPLNCPHLCGDVSIYSLNHWVRILFSNFILFYFSPGQLEISPVGFHFIFFKRKSI